MCRYASLVVLTTLFFCGAAAPVRADNRVALVIGNGAYVHVPHLPNPTHDAEDVAAAFPEEEAVQQMVAFLRAGGNRAICTPRDGKDEMA